MAHELDAYEAHYAEATRYEEAWPNYCYECNGYGYHVDYYDPSPAGVSLGSGTLMETHPCGHCIERDYNRPEWTPRCPRCAGGIVTDPDYADDPITCYNCGFRDGVTLGHPGWPEEPFDSDPPPEDFCPICDGRHSGPCGACEETW